MVRRTCSDQLPWDLGTRCIIEGMAMFSSVNPNQMHVSDQVTRGEKHGERALWMKYARWESLDYISGHKATMGL